MTIEDYLRKVGRFAGDSYGSMVRGQFQSSDGASELDMLQCPSREEYAGLERAVAIMTPSERRAAEDLSDEQIEKIAREAGTDTGIFAIFMNGFCLEKRKARKK